VPRLRETEGGAVKFTEFRIAWRGEQWDAHARVTGSRVEVASLRRAADRDPQAFAAADPEEGSSASALGRLTRGEREEVYDLVFAAHARCST